MFFAFSLILLLINQNVLIDKRSINLLDMYIRSGFVLIGSTLSGIVALLYFHFKKKVRKKRKSKMK